MDVPCICPPKADGSTRHETDTITLRERLDFRSSLAAQNAVGLLKGEDPDATAADILAVLTESYVLSGVESWTVVDDKDKPIEPTRSNIRDHLLPRFDAAMLVAEEADERYREAVLDPLARRVSTSSPDTPIGESTSPILTSEEQNHRQSSPSSTTTTPTDDTGTTSLSLAGVSNSSPN